MKLRKGDQVKIVAGNDKGKQGKILAVLSDANRIIVEGINLKKRHQRPRTQGAKGEVISMPASFSASRVKIVCKKCGHAVRVGYSTDASGAKVRVCKKCNSET